ncbi:MAG TPA: translesion DNA synthesis-associated protein ImuA [Rhodoferax sp.]|mgnify:CR=1 FL=1|nr:translesion DNA synthesis-associated protein ImuA [Rhodoferax sp.]
MALCSVSSLLEDFGAVVWRADALARSASADAAALPSGHAELDARLPGGGWPVGALCEILQTADAQCEWRLLLPALRRLGQTVVLVGPPHAPFGPGLAAQGLNVQALLWVKADGLADRLWAAEQVLRCAGVDALLLWLPKARADHLRRLHLAAQSHAKLLFVMRPATAQDESSPALLRLGLSACAPAPTDIKSPASAAVVDHGAGFAADALLVQVLKRRGPPLAQTLNVRARHAPLSVLLALRDDGYRNTRSACGDLAPDRGGHALDRLAATA